MSDNSSSNWFLIGCRLMTHHGLFSLSVRVSFPSPVSPRHIATAALTSSRAQGSALPNCALEPALLMARAVAGLLNWVCNIPNSVFSGDSEADRQGVYRRSHAPKFFDETQNGPRWPVSCNSSSKSARSLHLAISTSRSHTLGVAVTCSHAIARFCCDAAAHTPV